MLEGKGAIMSWTTVPILALLAVGGVFAYGQSGSGEAGNIDLPRMAEITIEVELVQALRERRSIRSFAPGPLDRRELAALLWAAQGITEPATGYRTAPSAGATYPLEVYAVVGDVEGLDAGLYRYMPQRHGLEEVFAGDIRDRLYRAALRQQPVRDAPVVLVVTAVAGRTERRYGTRAERYVAMEAGHASQNIYLQATALELGTVAIGAFDDGALSSALELSDGEEPFYLMPVGRR